MPLNVPIGPHRRFVWTRSELATFKRIKDVFGGTVNDVVLAVVAGARARWLHRRGDRDRGPGAAGAGPGLGPGEDEHGQLGNRITTMRGPLPVYVEDPVGGWRSSARRWTG